MDTSPTPSRASDTAVDGVLGAWAVLPEGAVVMVQTQSTSFMSGDPSGLSNPEAEKSNDFIVDGPYSTLELARMAAETRLPMHLYPARTGWRVSFRRVDGLGAVARDFTCHDHTGEFGDASGWQQIVLKTMDELP